MKHTLWNENVELYELKNKSTYEYLYLYFDLFKRDGKTEKEHIINLDSKYRKICICFNFDKKVTDQDYENLKMVITSVVEAL